LHTILWQNAWVFAEKRVTFMINLAKKMSGLSPELQREVSDFIEFLLSKQEKRKTCTPTFDWEGSLKELGEKYTSTELQHKISEWRIGE
jgi:hypothetical protein